MDRTAAGQDCSDGADPAGERLLRRREVEKLAELSRSSIYRLMEAQAFPRPVKIGPRAVRWRLSDIIRWLRSRPLTGDSQDPPHAA